MQRCVAGSQRAARSAQRGRPPQPSPAHARVGGARRSAAEQSQPQSSSRISQSSSASHGPSAGASTHAPWWQVEVVSVHGSIAHGCGIGGQLAIAVAEQPQPATPQGRQSASVVHAVGGGAATSTH